MASKYTEAQKRATQKYQSGKVQVKITVSPEQKAAFRKLAAKQNKSLTALIIELLQNEIPTS